MIGPSTYLSPIMKDPWPGFGPFWSLKVNPTPWVGLTFSKTKIVVFYSIIQAILHMFYRGINIKGTLFTLVVAKKNVSCAKSIFFKLMLPFLVVEHQFTENDHSVLKGANSLIHSCLLDKSTDITKYIKYNGKQEK